MPFIRPKHNLRGSRPWLGVNYWSRRGGPFMWRTYDDELVRRELTTLRDNRVGLTRSFLFWPDFQPAPDLIDEDMMQRFCSFLRAHEDLGMSTLPTMLVGHMSGQNFDVPWRSCRDLYRDGAMLGQQAFFLREVVRRTGSSSAIVGWIISNEFPHLAGAAPREYVRAWASICVDAIRAGGSLLPVGIGDGAWGIDMTGIDNGYVLGDQLDLVDFIGPHVYAADDDQLRQTSRGAVACELAQVGLPVVLEEFGVSSAMASDTNAAHYYRQVLHMSLLGGATGWLAWNNTDFDLVDQEPYTHHAHELGFGLTTARGLPKPALAEIRAFGSILEQIDLPHCRRSPSHSAVLVPAQVSAGKPFVDQTDRQAVLPVTQHAYLAARRAGLAPATIREGTPLPDSGLLLVPSAKALLANSFEIFAERASAGLHVYLSYFAGTGAGMKGAWWPPLEPLFGVQHKLRYGLADVSPEQVTLNVCTSFGDLGAGDQVLLSAAGSSWSRAYLPFDVVSDEVDVLLADDAGQPMLVRRRIGKGAVYLGACPIEFWGSARPDANRDDQVWRIYRALGEEADALGKVAGGNPDVLVDTLERDDGEIFVWLVNVTADRQQCKVVPPEGTELVAVGDDKPFDVEAWMGAFEVVVARLSVRGHGRQHHSASCPAVTATPAGGSVRVS